MSYGQKMVIWVRRIAHDLDLWILTLVAAGVTVASVIGIADEKVVSTSVLGLLALMAVSQVRSRDQLADVSASWERRRTDLFGESFPEEYYSARSTASRNYFFAGITMARTLPTMTPDLKRILENGGSVRILLPNPSNEALLDMIAHTRVDAETPADMRRNILHALRTAHKTLDSPKRPGKLETRVTDVLPRVGINAMDILEPSGLVMVQMYQIRPEEESAPIFLVRPHDQPWFERFRAEIEALWSSGATWQDGVTT